MVILFLVLLVLFLLFVLFRVCIESLYSCTEDLKFHNDEIDINNVKFENRNLLNER